MCTLHARARVAALRPSLTRGLTQTGALGALVTQVVPACGCSRCASARTRARARTHIFGRLRSLASTRNAANGTSTAGLNVTPSNFPLRFRPPTGRNRSSRASAGVRCGQCEALVVRHHRKHLSLRLGSPSRALAVGQHLGWAALLRTLTRAQTIGAGFVATRLRSRHTTQPARACCGAIWFARTVATSTVIEHTGRHTS